MIFGNPFDTDVCALLAQNDSTLSPIYIIANLSEMNNFHFYTARTHIHKIIL